MGRKVFATNLNKSRLIIAFGIFSIFMLILCIRLGYIQFVKSDEYEKMAGIQQIRDEMILPKRGNILDCNNQELAVSSVTYSVWARVPDISKDKDRLKRAARIDETAKQLENILGMRRSRIRRIITSDKRLVKIAKYRKKSVADRIKKAELPGIYTEEEVKRVYPRGNFMCHELGSVTDDNKGLSGLELYYNSELAGIPGRWLKKTDVGGNPLAFGTKKYYEQNEGLNLVLTVDGVIQNYVEEEVRRARRKYGSKSASCIIMETKTGKILAMATSPGFNPNKPRRPANPYERRIFRKMSPKKRLNYLNRMWRNPMVSNTYEPGSTAKLITTAASLEEGLTNKNECFYCNGAYPVSGVKVKCWSYYNPHGSEDLYKSVGNSCNPVFMQLALRMGKEKYYEYFNLFGLDEKTNIDFPGEANSIVLPKDKATRLDLAIMGFGQTNAVTALQLVSAVSAIGNGGNLMEPGFAKALIKQDGTVIKKFKPKKIRQAISKETADEMCKIMEYVVEKGGGNKAYIPGYRIGGKTGTAQKAGKGGYTSKVISSFIGMAPMDDPDITVLFVIDSPAGNLQGGVIAAPAARRVFKKVLKYRDISMRIKGETVEKSVSGIVVPDIKGKKYTSAIKILKKKKIKYIVEPKRISYKNFTVKGQYPEAGEKLSKKGVLYIYRK